MSSSRELIEALERASETLGRFWARPMTVGMFIERGGRESFIREYQKLADAQKDARDRLRDALESIPESP